VVDHERHRQRHHQGAQRHDVGGVEVQHQVPPEMPDAVDHATEHREIRRVSEVPDEVEADTPDTGSMQRLEVGIAHAVVDDGDPAAATPGPPRWHRASRYCRFRGSSPGR